jgi:hypothetical protein
MYAITGVWLRSVRPTQVKLGLITAHLADFLTMFFPNWDTRMPVDSSSVGIHLPIPPPLSNLLHSA